MKTITLSNRFYYRELDEKDELFEFITIWTVFFSLLVKENKNHAVMK